MARNKVLAKKVVKSLLNNGMNQSEAARELGVTRQNIRKHVKENPIVKAELSKIDQALEDIGVDERAAAKVIKDAMNAEVVVTATFEGSITDEKSYIDHPTRLKANEQYLKVKKIIGEKEPPKPEQHLHFHLGDKNTNDLLGEIRSQLTSLGRGQSGVPS